VTDGFIALYLVYCSIPRLLLYTSSIALYLVYCSIPRLLHYNSSIALYLVYCPIPCLSSQWGVHSTVQQQLFSVTVLGKHIESTRLRKCKVLIQQVALLALLLYVRVQFIARSRSKDEHFIVFTRHAALCISYRALYRSTCF
jgi:hypothetical protein